MRRVNDGTVARAAAGVGAVISGGGFYLAMRERRFDLAIVNGIIAATLIGLFLLVTVRSPS